MVGDERTPPNASSEISMHPQAKLGRKLPLAGQLLKAPENSRGQSHMVQMSSSFVDVHPCRPILTPASPKHDFAEAEAAHESLSGSSATQRVRTELVGVNVKCVE